MEAILTKYNKLDTSFGGFEIGDITVIGGRPSFGKSAFIQNCIINNISEISMFYLSLNYNKDKIYNRFISLLSDIDIDNIKTHYLNEIEQLESNEARKKLDNSKLIIESEIFATFKHIKFMIYKTINNYPNLKLIILDDIQHIKNFDKKSEKILRELKIIAVEYKIALVLISQINRKVEERKSKFPLLSDLHGSKFIESFADKILLFYREDIYHERYEITKEYKSRLKGKNYVSNFIAENVVTVRINVAKKNNNNQSSFTSFKFDKSKLKIFQEG